MKIRITCAEVVWIDKLRSTYCMQEKGHTGPHDPPEAGAFVKIAKTENKEKEVPQLCKEEVLLSNYGPYSSDDPRSRRGY